jgi:hypothetical protein
LRGGHAVGAVEHHVAQVGQQPDAQGRLAPVRNLVAWTATVSLGARRRMRMMTERVRIVSEPAESVAAPD